jgi:hypothetical protein
MKNIVLTIVVFLITASAFTQSKPSKKVRNAFYEKYENAEIIRWENETERNRVTLWKGFFKQNDVLRVAWYDPKANWIQTKTEISKDELPEAVLKSIEDYYYQYKIVITAKFINPETEGYEVFLSSEMDGFDVQFSKEGDVLNRAIRSEAFKPIDSEGKEIEE